MIVRKVRGTGKINWWMWTEINVVGRVDRQLSGFKMDFFFRWESSGGSLAVNQWCEGPLSQQSGVQWERSRGLVWYLSWRGCLHRLPVSVPVVKVVCATVLCLDHVASFCWEEVGPEGNNSLHTGNILWSGSIFMEHVQTHQRDESECELLLSG